MMLIDRSVFMLPLLVLNVYSIEIAATCYKLLSEGKLLRTEACLTVEIVIHDDNVISTRQAPRCFVSKTT